MEEFLEGNKIPLPDLSYLKEMADGDDAFIKEVITIFLDEGPKMLDSMKKSADSGDHEKLRFVTHKLITQLTYVGIITVIPDVKKINKESKEMPDLTERIDRIIKIANFSIEYLKTLV